MYSTKFWTFLAVFWMVLPMGCGQLEGPGRAYSSGTDTLQKPIIQVEKLSETLQKELEGWIEIQAKRAGLEVQWTDSNQADLIWLNPDQLVDKIVKKGDSTEGSLAPIPEDLIRARGSLSYEDIIPWIRDRIISWNRIPVALPLTGEGYILAYRKDIVADLRTKNPGLPDGPPSSWTDFQKLAEALAKGSPKKVFGFSPLGKSSKDIERLFLMIHASIASRGISLDEKTDGLPESVMFGYLYDLKSGAFQPGSEASAEAARIWATLMPFCDKGAKDPVDCFLSGETALGIFPLSVLARAANRPELVGKIGIGQIPGSLVYADSSGKLVKSTRPNYRPMLGSGGVLMGVRAASARVESAWKLAAALASPPGDHLALGSHTAGATRNDQVLRIRWDRFNLDTKTTASLREILRGQLLASSVKNPAPYPRRPDGAERTAVLVQLLETVRDEASAKAFPEAWAKGIAEIEQRNQKTNNLLGSPLEIARWSVGLIP